MGNQSSKPKGSNYPAFTRSDTSTSVRSSRSLRSRKSISRESQYSDAASFKTSHSNNEQQPMSRRNSGLNADFGNLSLHDQKDSQDIHNEAVLNDDELPPSMVQVAPKSPILKSERSSTSLQHLSIEPQTQQTADGEYAQQELSQTLIIPQQPQQHRSNSNDFSIRSHSPSVSSRSNPSTPVSGSFHIDPLDIPEQERPSLSRNHDIDLENTIQRLLDAGYAGKRTKNLCLKNSEVAVICSKAREIFLSQPSLLELSAPVKIVGDVHGQFSDLIRIFTKCGFPPASNYLFLGDYVDRGKQSLETILLLLCYKIKYPENFFLLRGNHECAQVTRAYGFFDECKRRTNLKTWKIFIDTFNTLPITAVVASKIFCVHGGLSPVLNSMDEIRRIKRPTDVPDYGLLNDLLWSDPADTSNEWEDNERGVSYCFNRVAINKFLNKFHFDLVVRAHMVVEDGYEFFNDRSLVTVFSAPNYCGEFDNWGAVMSVSEELLCSFELLDPLDSAALKKLMKQGKYERIAAGNRSSPSHITGQSY